MSIDIYPPLPPDHLQREVKAAQQRELEWFVAELRETLVNIKHGLEDCYALLAPIDPGSTLVLSTPRNEIVKGTVTRVGTRIVKGTIHLRLRTLPHQTLTLNPDHPIHLAPLTSLQSLLNQSIDLLTLTLSYSYPSEPSQDHQPSSTPQFLSAQLRLLSQHISRASALLKGAPLPTTDPAWTSRSAAPSHFTPPLAQPHSGSSTPALSFYLTIQDACLVLWLRTLEPFDAPVAFGTKLALAIGTARRLEHDEAERVFGYCCNHSTIPYPDDQDRENLIEHAGSPAPGPQLTRTTSSTSSSTKGAPLSGTKKRWIDVYVREKVRVESADPSLMSLSAKLMALGHTLALARQNLEVLLGEDVRESSSEGSSPMEGGERGY